MIYNATILFKECFQLKNDVKNIVKCIFLQGLAIHGGDHGIISFTTATAYDIGNRDNQPRKEDVCDGNFFGIIIFAEIKIKYCLIHIIKIY